MKKSQGKQKVIKLLIFQLIFACLIALTTLLIWGLKPAISSFLGGIVAVLPAFIFTQKLFSYSGARAARQIVKSFYLGEALKIVSSIFLFAFVFMLYDVQPLSFFVTYIAVVMAHWFSPLFIDNHKRSRTESD